NILDRCTGDPPSYLALVPLNLPSWLQQLNKQEDSKEEQDQQNQGQGYTVEIVEYPTSEAALSICPITFNKDTSGGRQYLAVGCAIDLQFQPQRTCSGGVINLYIVSEDTQLDRNRSNRSKDKEKDIKQEQNKGKKEWLQLKHRT
ncbi:MAG: hypothetical protein EZS28_055736, partial [Streblomastix strix]